MIVNLIAFTMLVVIAMASGAASAGLLYVLLRRHFQRHFDNRIGVENLLTHITVNAQDPSDGISYTINASAAELTTSLVCGWLDKQGLVMAPKGRDFKAASPASVKEAS